MENMVYKEIKLENNQTLVISDMSRKISVDAYVVIMKAVMKIKIEKQLFLDNTVSDFKLKEILAVLGDTAVYEYSIERNFIMTEQKDKIFESLVKTFLDNLGQYVAKPNFPGRFVLKEYKDKIK